MLRLLSILLAIALIAPACSEDSTTNPDANTSSKNSFNVSGGGYTNASFKGYAGDTAGVATESGGSGGVSFFGTTPNATEYFSLALLIDEAKTGDYPVSGSSGSAMTMVIIKGSSTKTYFAGTGTISVKSWNQNGRSSGTFSGTFIDPTNPTSPLTVTDGKFDVDFTK
jgi:hypothetical protein